jgi:hypothetical protein
MARTREDPIRWEEAKEWIADGSVAALARLQRSSSGLAFYLESKEKVRTRPTSCDPTAICYLSTQESKTPCMGISVRNSRPSMGPLPLFCLLWHSCRLCRSGLQCWTCSKRACSPATRPSMPVSALELAEDGARGSMMSSMRVQARRVRGHAVTWSRLVSTASIRLKVLEMLREAGHAVNHPTSLSLQMVRSEPRSRRTC